MDKPQPPRSSGSSQGQPAPPESLLAATAESSPHRVHVLPYELTGELAVPTPDEPTPTRLRRPALVVALYGTVDNESEVPLASTLAIVDSGADYTTVSDEWARVLGVDLSDCVPIATTTAGAPATHYAYGGGVVIEVRRERLLIPVIHFAEDLRQSLLGRRDFFMHYLVAFDQRHSRFFLERLPALDDDDDDELDRVAVAS